MSGSVKEFRLPYIEAHGEHPVLGIAVDLIVPANDASSSPCRAFIEGRYFEPFTHTAFKLILEHSTKKNAVHAGAYFGDMLDTLSRSAQTVFAFEPVLSSYYYAKRNAERLALSNVVLINAGLGDATSIARIQTKSGGTDAGGRASFDFNRSEDEELEYAPIFRLDDLPIDDVAVLHLDVEGRELAALTGAADLIERCSPILMIEDNAKNCGPFLLERGYVKCYRENQLDYWSVPADFDFVLSMHPEMERRHRKKLLREKRLGAARRSATPD